MTASSNGNAMPDLAYQDAILPGVSRTFALTIPQLPQALRAAITNAYLLCRIADTIEDEMDLPLEAIQAHHDRFIAVVRGQADAAAFAHEVVPLVAPRALPAERELMVNIPRVLDVTYSFNDRQRQALARCVAIMCHGMPDYQRRKSVAGLRDLPDMDRYCYYVAGVVGEMLTELFCDYSDEMRAKSQEMMRLAPSFGQGLQMVNILKDFWEDRREKGVCWMPQEVFRRHGVELARVQADRPRPGFAEAYRELIGVAHAHLRNALEYTLLIPSHEAGIRRFCLWALGLAVLTLRKIHATPDFISGRDVKVTRRTVKTTIVATNACARSDFLLRFLFARGGSGLPMAELTEWLHPAYDGTA